MKKAILGTLLIALATSTSAFAQGGAATGAATGAVGGAIVGGPAGAVVGATVGAAAGGIADDSRPRFRTYVTGQRHHSYRYENDLRVGADCLRAA
jgi:YMGG-like Gly-zipper